MTEHDKTSAPETAIAEQRAETWFSRVADYRIIDIEGYMLMAEWLKEIKRVVNLLDEETAPEIKQAHTLHKALIARRKKWSDRFEEAEGLAKGKLRYFVEQQAEAGNEIPKIDGVTFAETWTGEVVDESQIPREYMTPDLKKLGDVTKALKEATSISGWKVKSVRTVAVRS